MSSFLRKLRNSLILCALACILPAGAAHAWGRHDLITRIALDSPELARLGTIRVTPEPIEKAAPDLLARVIPGLQKWSTRYFREFDRRYDWTAPKPRPGATPRQALLWALEDNVGTPLSIPPEERGMKPTAADILVDHVDEPDGMLDGGLDRAPYLGRLSGRMSLFLGHDAHTHAFRHYYVPSSLLPPILGPKGMSPYRAALYARLAQGAFATGHPYWGYRFLAWSLHYVQDATQPWHTIFLPDFSFLSFSVATMKREVSALHYLTEAFADSWMIKTLPETLTPHPRRELASLVSGGEAPPGPWGIAKLTEELATSAHSKASELADLSRRFFQPIVDRLGDNLKLKPPFVPMGGLRLVSSVLDFSGNGTGATRFLDPLWGPHFRLAGSRDRLMRLIVGQVNAAIGGSRVELARILDLAQPGVIHAPRLSVIQGSGLYNPS